VLDGSVLLVCPGWHTGADELVVLQELDVGVDCTCVVYLVGWWGYGSLDTHSCVVWAMLVCSMYHNVSR